MSLLLPILQAASTTQDTAAAQGMGIVGSIIFLALFVVMVAAAWKIFEKAGEPGWACIVPIYSAIVMLRIAGKPWWWLFLFFIPFVGLIFAILVCIELAKNFGKGAGFGLGLAFLGFIFFPILAFGDARYIGTHRS